MHVNTAIQRANIRAQEQRKRQEARGGEEVL